MPLAEQMLLAEDLLSIEEASILTKRTKSSLYTLASRRQIPFHKDKRGKVFFRRSELLNWLFPQGIDHVNHTPCP